MGALLRSVALLSGLALLPVLGCKKSGPAPAAPPAAAATPPKPTPSEPKQVTPEPKPATPEPTHPAPEPTHPAPEPTPPAPVEAEAGCRALMILATPSEIKFEEGKDPPLVPPTSYTVLDVRFGKTETAFKQAPGLLVRDGGRTFALRIERTEQRGKEGKYAVADTWDRLVAIDLATQARSVWLEERGNSAETAKAFGPEDAFGATELDSLRLIHVVGIVGPIVSFFHEDTGYAGGVHGFDSTSVAAITAPSGQPVSVPGLAPDLMTAGAAEAQRIEKQRTADGDEGFEAATLKPEQFSLSGLGLDPAPWPAGPLSDANVADRAARPLGLYAYTRLDCCSWAENHNLLDLSIPIALPDALAKVTGRPDPGPERLLLAPDGCGAVGLNSGLVLTRKGREGSAASKQLEGPSPQSLIGVYWIDANDPIAIETLPNPLAVRMPD